MLSQTKRKMSVWSKKREASNLRMKMYLQKTLKTLKTLSWLLTVERVLKCGARISDIPPHYLPSMMQCILQPSRSRLYLATCLPHRASNLGFHPTLIFPRGKLETYALYYLELLPKILPNILRMPLLLQVLIIKITISR